MILKPSRWMLSALCAALVACSTAPDDLCELEAASDYPKDHPACLFYTGTDHYRSERYAEARAAWQELVVLPAAEEEARRLFAAARNNLGYLQFNGLGVDQDRAAAVELWKSAAAMGNEEAEYHLCHAYIDAPKPLGDPAAALVHCDQARALYQGMAERTEAQESVLAEVERYRAVAEKAVARQARPKGPPAEEDP